MKLYFQNMKFVWFASIFLPISFISCSSSLSAVAESSFEEQALEYFCGFLVADGYDARDPLHLDQQPSFSVVEIFALHLLKDPVGLTPDDAEKDAEMGKSLYESSSLVSAEMENRRSLCRWQQSPEAVSDKSLTIKYSPMLINPHATSHLLRRGIFVKVSVGAIGGDWYWIVKREGHANGFIVVSLDINGA